MPKKIEPADKIYEEVLQSSPPEILETAEKLFKEFPFDEKFFAGEDSFAVEEYDTPKSTAYITAEEKDKLANENMALVYYIVSKFSNTNIDPDELFSVALVGYEKALSKFNPAKLTKFSTFAYRCIQNEIFYFIRGEKKIGEKNISLSACIATDKNGNDLEVDETVPADIEDMDKGIIRDEMSVVLQEIINDYLTDAEKLIITRRFGIGTDTMTQNELAKMVSMSQANISKKEKNILEKMRKILMSKYKIKSPY